MAPLIGRRRGFLLVILAACASPLTGGELTREQLEVATRKLWCECTRDHATVLRAVGR